MTLFLLILLLLLPFSFCSVQQGYNISEIDQVLFGSITGRYWFDKVLYVSTKTMVSPTVFERRMLAVDTETGQLVPTSSTIFQPSDVLELKHAIVSCNPTLLTPTLVVPFNFSAKVKHLELFSPNASRRSLPLNFDVTEFTVATDEDGSILAAGYSASNQLLIAKMYSATLQSLNVFRNNQSSIFYTRLPFPGKRVEKVKIDNLGNIYMILSTIVNVSNSTTFLKFSKDGLQDPMFPPNESTSFSLNLTNEQYFINDLGDFYVIGRSLLNNEAVTTMYKFPSNASRSTSDPFGSFVDDSSPLRSLTITEESILINSITYVSNTLIMCGVNPTNDGISVVSFDTNRAKVVSPFTYANFSIDASVCELAPSQVLVGGKTPNNTFKSARFTNVAVLPVPRTPCHNRVFNTRPPTPAPPTPRPVVIITRPMPEPTSTSFASWSETLDTIDIAQQCVGALSPPSQYTDRRVAVLSLCGERSRFVRAVFGFCPADPRQPCRTTMLNVYTVPYPFEWYEGVLSSVPDTRQNPQWLLKSKTRTEPTWLFTCVKDCQRLEVVKLTPSPHANDVTADAAYFNYLVQAKTVYPDLTSKSVVLTRCTDTICSVHQEDATVTSRSKNDPYQRPFIIDNSLGHPMIAIVSPKAKCGVGVHFVVCQEASCCRHSIVDSNICFPDSPKVLSMGLYRFANLFALSPEINFLFVYNGNMILCWGQTDCEQQSFVGSLTDKVRKPAGSDDKIYFGQSSPGRFYITDNKRVWLCVDPTCATRTNTSILMTREPTNEHPASYLDIVDYREQVIGGVSLSFGSGVVLQFHASIERTTTTELPDIRVRQSKVTPFACTPATKTTPFIFDATYYPIPTRPTPSPTPPIAYPRFPTPFPTQYTRYEPDSDGNAAADGLRNEILNTFLTIFGYCCFYALLSACIGLPYYYHDKKKRENRRRNQQTVVVPAAEVNQGEEYEMNMLKQEEEAAAQQNFQQPIVYPPAQQYANAPPLSDQALYSGWQPMAPPATSLPPYNPELMNDDTNYNQI